LARSKHRPWRQLLASIRRLLKREPEPPDDPYALVGAPKKPRPPYRRTAAAEPLE